MANERTYPCLPCADIDEAIGFYEALGFHRTYRQKAPNPYAVVAREDLHVHLFGMSGFDATESYGCAIVAVPDVDALYQSFAVGLRAAYGKLPTKGIPRITRPRKRYGTVRGFSVVDVGGNWLRVSKLDDREEDETATEGLEKILDVAARLGDSHGDQALALRTLENGLARHIDAPMLDRARALLCRAVLAVRLDDPTRAASSFAAAMALDLSEVERKMIDGEVEHTAELVREIAGDRT